MQYLPSPIDVRAQNPARRPVEGPGRWPGAARLALLWGGLLLLPGCGGGGAGTDSGGNEPLALEILNPEEKASYPLGDLAIEVSWSESAEDPDSFEVLLNGEVKDIGLSAGGDLAAGSLELGEVGAQELEVRAFRAGELIEFKRREFIATLPPFPGLEVRATFIGDTPSIAYGQTATRLADLNGDGIDEVVVGARLANFGGIAAGRIEVRSGAGGASLLVAHGLPGSEFGEGLSYYPDRDGDGRPEILVGAPHDDAVSVDGGTVSLLSSQTGAPLLILRGSDSQEFLGNSVATVGDVNNDGFADILVGGAKSNVAGGFSGRASLFSGADGARLLKIEGEEPVVQLGIAVDAFGDQNGDGVPDLLVGCWGATDNGGSSGAVLVFSGLDGSQLLRIPGEIEDDHYGLDVARFPDIDGDGISEILAGAWEHDPNGKSNAGAAYLHSGRNGALIHKFVGENVEDRFGSQVAAPGDLDGDAICDILIGAPFTSDTRGSTYLYSGASGELLTRIDGFTPIALSGSCVETLGDIDGDGWPEFLIGAPIEIFQQQPYGTARIIGRAAGQSDLSARGQVPAQALVGPLAVGAVDSPLSPALQPTALRRLGDELRAQWPKLPTASAWLQLLQ
jgi:hypothetical protein